MNIAECSLSTGIILAPFFWAVSFTRFHAITTVSLFASAKSIPFSKTRAEGLSPAAPAIPFTAISALLSFMSFSRPSIPSFEKTVPLQLNSRHNSFTFSSFFPAEIPHTSKLPLILRAMSRVWLPIDPVQPKTRILFFIS